MLDEAGLRAAIEKLGWEIQPHGKATFRSVHQTDEGELEVYVRLDENWLVASVVPFLATQGDNSYELARWLLRMNRDMFQAKFAYDEDGDVVLTVELPTESLDFGEIEGALKNLLQDAIRHRATLRIAAES
ncbi:MAG: YbjN domain-containing protein [Myxococcota bacterium]